MLPSPVWPFFKRWRPEVMAPAQLLTNKCPTYNPERKKVPPPPTHTTPSQKLNKTKHELNNYPPLGAKRLPRRRRRRGEYFVLFIHLKRKKIYIYIYGLFYSSGKCNHIRGRRGFIGYETVFVGYDAWRAPLGKWRGWIWHGPQESMKPL